MSNPVTAPASPTYSKSRNAFESVSFPRADESSCTESELSSSIAAHIRRFDNPRRHTAGTPPVSAGPGTGSYSAGGMASLRAGANGANRRPSLRRGKTEEPVSTHTKEVSRSRKVFGSTGRGPRLERQLASCYTRTAGVETVVCREPSARIAPLRRRLSCAEAAQLRRTRVDPLRLRRATDRQRRRLKAGPRPIIGRSGASAAAAARRRRCTSSNHVGRDGRDWEPKPQHRLPIGRC